MDLPFTRSRFLLSSSVFLDICFTLKAQCPSKRFTFIGMRLDAKCIAVSHDVNELPSCNLKSNTERFNEIYTLTVHTVSQKNDRYLFFYNLKKPESIFIIFGTQYLDEPGL